MTRSALRPHEGEDDYVKKIINQSQRGFGLSLDKSCTPKNSKMNKGPTFGQSRISVGNQQSQS